jgi:epsilon-lactone hydrolase
METRAAVDFVLARDRLRGNVSDYAGGADPAAAGLSPLFADLRGIAPLLIQCGSNGVLLDDATRLAAAAAAADVAVQLDVTPGMRHVFQTSAADQASSPDLDQANAALARTGALLQAHLQLAE